MRRSSILASLAILFTASQTLAHDIPNARVDRSIQVTVRPGVLKVNYEVSLAELTLVQDLRALIGSLPGGDRRTWFDRYGEICGPLNAKGLRIAVDGQLLELRVEGFKLVVEDHLRYSFQFTSAVPSTGKLAIRDTNYEASEGTSRLAIKGVEGIVIHGDDLPNDVAKIPIQPLWKLSNEEERRTRQVDVTFDSSSEAASARRSIPDAAPASPEPTVSTDGLSRLLDRSDASVLVLCAIAFCLGAAHSIQPGHGKTLVAAASIGGRGGWWRGPLLAVSITLAHIGGVMAIVIVLWMTHTSRYPEINRTLAQCAGFVIASIGLWRLGRHLMGRGEHDGPEETPPASLGLGSLIGLGLAGGVVPCWDAVLLVILAEAIGRLGLGLVLLAAFSMGMAAVLVTVGLAASRFRDFLEKRDSEKRWIGRLGIASAIVLTLIGIYLMVA